MEQIAALKMILEESYAGYIEDFTAFFFSDLNLSL